MIQCNPPVHVLTPLGEGNCLFIIDYGEMVNTIWPVHLFDTAQVKHFDSDDIRVYGNPMWGIEDPVPTKKKKKR